jgi:hypothetical protein
MGRKMEGCFINYQRGENTGLWRNRAAVCHKQENTTNSLCKVVFPSGRQALSAALQQVGFGRTNRIAVPEWSSHCVINAVGKVAMPIPINEVIRYNIKVDGILLYEQWGWPLSPAIKSSLQKRFENAVVILDRVDSSDLYNENRIHFYPETKQIDIISLSKIIGLTGGGLAKINGNYLQFEPNSVGKYLCSHLWSNIGKNSSTRELLHIHKEDIQSLHPDLEQWLSFNDLNCAINDEFCKRHQNLSEFFNSSLTSNWPDWMLKAFEQGAGPGIVPLFRDASDLELKNYKLFIKEKHHIDTEIYHFNWSGNFLDAKYQKCLAFPIHGLVEDVRLVISELENF